MKSACVHQLAILPPCPIQEDYFQKLSQVSVIVGAFLYINGRTKKSTDFEALLADNKRPSPGKFTNPAAKHLYYRGERFSAADLTGRRCS